jgi:tight adherence protein C
VTPAAGLAGIAAALAAVGLADLLALVRARRKHRGAARARGVAAIARIGRVLGPRAPRSLEARIAAAGLATPAADVMALKAGAAMLAPAAAVLLVPAPGRLGPVVLLGAALAGFAAPDVWLRRRTRARTRAIEAELADVLDLLRVAVAAGLAPKRALAEVGRRHQSALGAELRRAATRTALGTPAQRALEDLERRCPATGIPALTAALRRAERHGAPLCPALHSQARHARARSAQRTAESAARAAPQIQLVVALLLVPAVLLLVAAALLPALTGYSSP